VSTISSSEAMEGPRMWKRTKVMSPFFAASINPMLRSACSVGDSKPARMSIKLTAAPVELTVSKIVLSTHMANIDIAHLRWRR